MSRLFCTIAVVLLTPALVDPQIVAATQTSAQTLSQVGGQGTSVRIVGKLTEDDDRPIAGARIGIANWRGDVWQPVARSGSNGEYTLIVRLQPGEYLLIAAVGPYEVGRRSFRVATPDDATQEIDLEAFGARSDFLPRKAPKTASLPRGTFSRGPTAEPPPPPPPPPDQAIRQIVNVYYVTNRSIQPGADGRFRDELDLTPVTSYGVCEVSIPPIHQPGELERPAVWRFQREDATRHFVITGRRLLPGEAAFQQQLHTAFEQSGSEAFVFIHGYNVGFDDAVMRTAQLFKDLQFNGVPILFSWPGQSAWWRYAAAESAVDSSARALEAFLGNILMTEKLTAVNVVAHSLGNRILTTALERLSLRGIQPGFANIVMAAPDINVADFSAVSTVLRTAAKRTTIYSSSRDLALTVSKAFHSYPRLGEAPPRQLSPQIDTIDASAIKRDLLGHSYFGASASVIRDMFLLVKQGLDPSQRFLLRRDQRNLAYWVIQGDQ